MILFANESNANSFMAVPFLHSYIIFVGCVMILSFSFVIKHGTWNNEKTRIVRWKGSTESRCDPKFIVALAWDRLQATNHEDSCSEFQARKFNSNKFS